MAMCPKIPGCTARSTSPRSSIGLDDLLCEIVADLEAIAEERGSLGQLLYEQYREFYKLSAPCFVHKVLAA
jgi:hypothetical protein